MTATSRFARFGDWLWFTFWLVGSSAACLSTALNTGATFDEPLHIARSVEGWRSGSHEGLLHLGAMPLALDLYSLPIYLYERCNGVAFDLQRDVETLIPWFRAGALVFWCLLLTYARLIGRRLAGPWGGRLAVAFVAVEPTMLAHASLGGTDIAVTACMMAFVYHFRTGREATWPRRFALPALWYGAAVLAKASALVFGPLVMVVLEIERMVRQGTLRAPNRGGLRSWVRETWNLSRPIRGDMTVIVGAGMALVFVYCGSDWKTEPSFIAWANSLPEGTSRQAMIWLSEHLRIFSNAGEALVRQIGHNIRGHGVFLLGNSGARSFWYYFPIALTMKLSIPLLLAPLVVAVVRARALLNWAMVTAAALLIFSVNCHVQIGIRLVLPLCVLLAIGLAASIARAIREVGPGWRSRLLKSTAIVGIAWTGLAALTVWPNWLCYLNEFWGGTDKGYLCLSDSNYDWGQGVPELARWQQAHAHLPLDVWYFGTDPLMDRLPVEHLQLNELPITAPTDVIDWVRGRYLAASTTLVYGSYVKGKGNQAHLNSAKFLRHCKPVARTSTFLIYDFTEPAEFAWTN